MKLRDFIGLKNKNKLDVMEVKNEYMDYYTVKLKLNGKVHWRPGEHGAFTLPDNKVRGKKWRAFSVASVVEEGYLLIGTRTGKNVSSFKENLINMKRGDKVNVIGPFGWFTLKDDTSPIVLIASGVGITPIRALAKELERDESRLVEIIYAAKDYHLFKDEIKCIAQNNKNITLHLVKKEDMQEKIRESANKYKNFAYYYISGSFGIIKMIRKQLKKQGIKGTRLVHDPFFGY